ncbi:SDR family NAD(P)-dependent oxidoreductase [Shinella sp.]|uniref:SDR family NAD(P)-dependent oxidoreductase n=1 Tax=Shinella sp. TaxID=1870904 RepID=UPI0039E4C4F9
MSGVAGRTVIVTGAGRGLGREYALHLAGQGAAVVVNDLGVATDGSGSDQGPADAVVAEITARGGRAMASQHDISSDQGAQAMVEAALERFGAVHGLVNNAGILRDSSFPKMSDAQWDSVIAVHLRGSFLATHAVWPHFREQSFGRVVMVTSTSGLFGNFGQANYAAAKMGLVGLSQTLAIEGAKRNILVNALAPMAATRMTAGVASEEVLSALPADFVAPVVTHLLGESLQETGMTFVAGGGTIRRVMLFEGQVAAFASTPSMSELQSAWPKIVQVEGATEAANPAG